MQDVIVGGIPLVIFIFGLCELAKQLGVKGKKLRVVSALIGMVLGTAYRLTLGMPKTYAEWFATVMFGMLAGLTASGIFDWSNPRFPKLNFSTTGQPGDETPR